MKENDQLVRDEKQFKISLMERGLFWVSEIIVVRL